MKQLQVATYMCNWNSKSRGKNNTEKTFAEM